MKYCFFLSISLLIVLSPCLSVDMSPINQPQISLTANGSIVVDVQFSAPVTQELQIHPASTNHQPLSVQSVEIPGIRSAGHPGEPVLPVYPVSVLIPQDRELVTVEVDPGEAVELSGRYRVKPGQYQVPLPADGPFEDLGPDQRIYGQQVAFPGNLVEQIKPQYCRGYKLVTFNLRPVQYFPLEETVKYYPALSATVITQPITFRNEEVVRCRNLTADKAWVKRKVINPEGVDRYFADARTFETALSGSRDNYPYVIVTIDDYVPAFFDFLVHKNSRGLSGTIVTMSWIHSSYSGRDDAEKLRNFIIDAYNNWSTEYILLGGDHDRSDLGGESEDVIVPRRDFLANTDFGKYEYEVPSDMYYVCLDGSFDDNGNEIWGEPTDGIGGGDIDWFGEVHVGRACVDSVQEVFGFSQSIMNYENEDPSSDYMKKAWMVGESFLVGINPTYGGDYKDEIRLGSSMHGYTTLGFPEDWQVDTLYDRDLPSAWSSSTMIDILNANNFTVLNHVSDSSDLTYCMRILNDDVDNNLHNTIGWLGYSQGSYCGSFDDRISHGITCSTDCICEHLTTQAQGSFAFVGNSREGWLEPFTTNGSSQYYDRQFFDAIFGEEIVEIGAANQDSKEDNIGFLEYGAHRWCAYELNLFGCPQTPFGGGITSSGIIGLDRFLYSIGVPMGITVRDLDLNTNPEAVESVDVTVTTVGGDSETVTLTETGIGSAIFSGSIIVAGGSVSPGNNVIDAVDTETLTATYIDAEDGTGAMNVPRTADAHADFTPPVIYNVAVTDITSSEAKVIFNTNQGTHAQVFFGTTLPPETPSSGSIGTSHVIMLSNLDACTEYFFKIQAEDHAGNITVDDASGAYYHFTTWQMIPVLLEDMNTNPGWSVEGLWAWGQPTGGAGSHGGPDPTSGYTGSNVCGYNLTGGYPNNMNSTLYLTTNAIDCSGGNSAALGFWCWLGVEGNYSDNANIDVSNDNGTSWTTIWSNPSSNIDMSAWEYWEFDISDIADGASQVKIRWGMGESDSYWSCAGWNIDDVLVTYLVPCNKPSLMHYSHVMDDSAGNNDGQINGGETINMTVTLANPGAEATNVTATLRSANPHVIITQDTVNFPDIPQWGTGTSLTSFEFIVSTSVQDEEIIPFTIAWYSNESDGFTELTEIAAAPALAFSSSTILDQVSGDGDGVLDPGESTQLMVELANSGTGYAHSVHATLTSDHPEYITISENQADFPDIVGGGAEFCLAPYFSVAASPSTPEGTMIAFTLDITAENYSHIASFSREVSNKFFARRYRWDLNTNPGWTCTGEWEWGVPEGHNGDPSSGFTGVNVYGWNLAGDYADNKLMGHLKTTSIDCSNLQDVEVRFKRWLGVNPGCATIEISTVGIFFDQIWVNNEEINDQDWQSVAYDISSIADGYHVYLRWGWYSGSSFGWNIDDVEIWGRSSDPVPTSTPETPTPTPTLTPTFTPSPTPTPFICLYNGDVDADGDLTPQDALLTFQIFMQIIPDPTDAELCYANCDGNTSITPEDGRCIFMHYLSSSCSCTDEIAETDAANYSVDSQPSRRLHEVPGTLNLITEISRTGSLDLFIDLADHAEFIQAYGLKLLVPDGLHYDGADFGKLTAGWEAFGAHINGSIITLGGFDPISTISADATGTLAVLHFSGATTIPQFEIIQLVDNLAGFIVAAN